MSGLLDAVSFREFWTEDQIRKLVARYIGHTTAVPDPKSPDQATDDEEFRTLLIFTTSKQQTWLVADPRSLRCILDDRRKEEPRVQWTLKRDEVEPLRANYEYSRASGVLYIGGRPKGWLFSKNLFQTIDVAEAVKQLMSHSAR